MKMKRLAHAQNWLVLMLLGVVMLPAMALAAELESKKYYRLYDDGGEHAAEACELVTKRPTKLSKIHFKTSLKSYLGSEQIEFAEKNEAGIDAFEHYFSNAADCKMAVKQLQKEYGY